MKLLYADIWILSRYSKIHVELKSDPVNPMVVG